MGRLCCIKSFLHIKPQHRGVHFHAVRGCIILFLYIKPQLFNASPNGEKVVLYRFSTSNHNSNSLFTSIIRLYYIVSLHQTTTRPSPLSTSRTLYYIVSLHQTTTWGGRLRSGRKVVLYRFSTSNHNRKSRTTIAVMLYYIVSLHQTTTIKRKQTCQNKLYYIVSLHQTTTFSCQILLLRGLYYIVSLHQTTTFQPL